MFVILAFLSIAIFLRTRVPVFNVSAVETAWNIGVYWDKRCTTQASSINWGTLSPGQTTSVMVYVQNKGYESFVLLENTSNWNPTYSSQYLHFSWSCQNRTIEASKVISVTQTLSVSPHIKGISTFNFNIGFEARDHLFGDINLDGIIDVFDMTSLSAVVGLTLKDANWNPNADLNEDGVIDIMDAVILTSQL
jgi:hypothetical protein